jgi:flavin reductase (DIM6/NTAB) family NADH-FMN oxidoreductase RutF
MPLVLVGSIAGGQPNYMANAHVGIMDFTSISVSVGKNYQTNAGIKDTRTLSINIPSVDLVEKADYCGLTSGKRTNKAALFTTFYGTLPTAPMIVECPVTMECSVRETVDFPNHSVFIGEIVNTYYDDHVLTDGVLDLAKVQPILFHLNDKGYWKIGERFATAWNVGQSLKQSEAEKIRGWETEKIRS